MTCLHRFKNMFAGTSRATLTLVNLPVRISCLPECVLSGKSIALKHIFLGYNADNIERKLLMAVQALQYMKETTTL
jgi:hypothetical protein